MMNGKEPVVPGLHRRTFLKRLGVAAAGAKLLAAATAGSAVADPPSQTALADRPRKKTYRAAAIGSTGHGGFGHGLDRALVGLPGVELVAIADDEPAGLQAAGRRNGVNRLYRSHQRMLEQERIDLVSIGMRHAEPHEALVVDCARAGAHIYCEKPLAPDLASIDRMLAACDASGVKLAVALPNRASLAVARALAMVRDGRIGKLLSLRARGKEDHRGGGEDLMVLGYHMLDLMCLFAGHPRWAFARVLEGDREMVRSDARAATEPIGPVAGDCAVAMYGFREQTHGYFESHRGLEGGRDRFSLEIHGSGGIITMRSQCDVMWFNGPIFNPAKPHHWQPISTPEWDAIDDKTHWCHQQLVLDLLQAVEDQREPISSGQQARWVQEMIQSVYVSHLARARVALPLSEREHPLR